MLAWWAYFTHPALRSALFLSGILNRKELLSPYIGLSNVLTPGKDLKTDKNAYKTVKYDSKAHALLS